jgi:hypothetical protein
LKKLSKNNLIKSGEYFFDLGFTAVALKINLSVLAVIADLS